MSNRSHSTNYHFEPTQRGGQVKYRQYQKGHKLGEGGFAACYKATRYLDRKVFAMKVIRLNDRRQLSNSRDRQRTSNHPKQSSVEKAKSEARLLRMCNHERIVKYQTDFIYDNNFYLIMEYCQRGNLSDMLKKRGIISQVETRYYLRQMIEALQYLKERRIIHRDLKPANFLLTDKLRLKIADFGLATEVINNEPSLKNMCGTPNFISPQLLQRKPYSYEVDLWSVGVIMYLMLYGIAPFQTSKKEAQQTYEKIKKCQYRLTDPRVSFQARNLISKILVAKPQQRIKLQDILIHPFMTNFQIPYQLSARYLRQHPDDRFLEYYQSQKQIQISKQSLNSKRQSLIPQPTNERSSFYNSFSLSQQHSLSLKQKSSKKERKKEKKEVKQSQKQNIKKKKSIAEIIRKFQKQEILTSSPYSQAQSLYKSDKNKWIQYPSYQGNSQLKFARIEKNLKKSNQIVSNKMGQKIFENKRQIQQRNGKIQIKEDELESFPSFTSILKNLSFQEMIDEKQEQNLLLYNLDFLKQKKYSERENFDEPYKKVKFDHKKIKILSREFNSSKNVNKTNEKGFLQENQQKKMSGNEQNEKVYVVEDFLLFTSSMHSNSNKIMKLIYCLKEQVINSEQKDKDNLVNARSDNSVNKIIGIIFNDNTSIITKIIIQNQTIRSKSVYIKNLQVNFNYNKNNKVSFSNLLSSQQSEPQTPESEGFCTDNQIDLGLNLFNFGKVIQETSIKNQHKKQQNQNVNNFSLNHQIRLKIRYSQDASRYFLHLFSQAAMNPTQLNSHHGYQKPSQQVLKQENFIFVKFFSSKQNQQKVFFELNNDTKHLMSLNSKKNHYQNIFKNHQIQRNKPKFDLYNVIIYNSFKKIGFIKQLSGRLIAKKWQNLKFLIQEKQNKQDEITVKKYQQDSNEDEVIKVQNNIGKNIQKTISPQNLISQLCLSFRDKMEFYYLRQKKLLGVFQNEKQNNRNKNQAILIKQNNCEFQIKDGRFDVQRNSKSEILPIMMMEKNQLRKL